MTKKLNNNNNKKRGIAAMMYFSRKINQNNSAGESLELAEPWQLLSINTVLKSYSVVSWSTAL